MSDPTAVSTRLIGEIFVERGIVTREQLDEALALQASNGGLLGEVIVSAFGVSRLELATVLAEQWRAVDASGASDPGSAESAPEPAVVAHPSPPAEPEQPRRPLGEIFVSSGAVSEAELERALERQRETGEKLGEILVGEGVIGRLELASALAEQWSELQVIRPPMPKEPEPWQEAALRAVADSPTGSAPAPPSETVASPTRAAEIAGLVDAVAELDLRVAELSSRQLPDIDAVRAEASAVAGRLEAMDVRVEQAVDRTTFEQLTVAVEGLRSELDQARAGLDVDADVRSAIETLTVRLEHLEQGGHDPRVDELSAGLAALGARLDALAASDEVRNELRELDLRLGEVGSILEQRVTAFDERVRALEAHAGGPSDLQHLRDAVGALTIAVDAARDGLVTQAELEAAVAQLGEHLASGAAGTDADATSRLESEIAQLAERVEALRVEAQERSGLAKRVDALEQGGGSPLDAVWAALEALQDRLDAPAVAHETLRTSLDELGARLDHVSAAVDGVPPADRIAALESALADDALGRLAAELDVLARGAARREDVDALREALAGDIEELGRAVESHRSESLSVDERLAGLQTALDSIATFERRVDEALATAERSEADAARAAQQAHGLAERLGAFVSAGELTALDERLVRAVEELGSRLDAVDATLATGTSADSWHDLDVAVQGLHERFAVLEVRLDEALAGRRDGEHVEGALRSRLEQLGAAIDELWSRIDGQESVDQSRLAEMASRVELGALAGDVRQRLDQLETTLSTERPTITPEDVEGRLAEAGALLDGLAQRVDEITRSAESTVGRQEAEERLGALGHALSEVDARATQGLGALDAKLEARLAEVASRAELSGLAAELGTRIGTIDGMASQLGARIDGELGSLYGRLSELLPRGELGEVWERIVGLEGRLAETTGRLEEGLVDALSRDELERRLEERTATTSTELSALLDARVTEIASRLEGVEQSLSGADLRSAAALDALQQDLAVRLGEIVHREEQVAFETALVERVDAQLYEISGTTNARLDALAVELHEAMTVLHGRIDELAAGLGHTGGRLAAVEHALPAPGLVDALATRIEETHRRVEEEQAMVEQRSHATERAIRKGLAGLGERLVASEQAYLEAGSALRRSIERLGAAVVEADARLAGEPLDPPAAGFVAFVPTADGYRLTSLDGPAPEVGAIVELEGLEGSHRAARITRSPLPLDRRPCVYLERVV